MFKTRQVAATAALLTLPFGLVACGSSKPSKDDVKAGMEKQVKENLSSMGGGNTAMQEKLATKVTNCIVDKVYDKVSADALTAMKEGDESAEVEKGDKSTVDKATQECTKMAMP